MQSIDRIDKENNLIRLTVGQVCSAGVAHNFAGEHKCYATPFIHKVWTGILGENYHQEEVGLALRIANDGIVIGNPSYRGNAIIAFLDRKFEDCVLHSVKVTRVNRRSVNVEPVEYNRMRQGATE